MSSLQALAIPAAICGVAGLCMIIARPSRLLPNTCPACGYSLEGLASHVRCPECGLNGWRRSALRDHLSRRSSRFIATWPPTLGGLAICTLTLWILSRGDLENFFFGLLCLAVPYVPVSLVLHGLAWRSDIQAAARVSLCTNLGATAAVLWSYIDALVLHRGDMELLRGVIFVGVPLWIGAAFGLFAGAMFGRRRSRQFQERSGP
jgi:hypothetical protein